MLKSDYKGQSYIRWHSISKPIRKEHAGYIKIQYGAIGNVVANILTCSLSSRS